MLSCTMRLSKKKHVEHFKEGDNRRNVDRCSHGQESDFEQNDVSFAGLQPFGDSLYARSLCRTLRHVLHLRVSSNRAFMLRIYAAEHGQPAHHHLV